MKDCVVFVVVGLFPRRAVSKSIFACLLKSNKCSEKHFNCFNAKIIDMYYEGSVKSYNITTYWEISKFVDSIPCGTARAGYLSYGGDYGRWTLVV